MPYDIVFSIKYIVLFRRFTFVLDTHTPTPPHTPTHTHIHTPHTHTHTPTSRHVKGSQMYGVKAVGLSISNYT